ncbi:hypothetical protein ACIRF8_01255 [Streptomyces sp. NPDC102406]|uniref:hypothetical protein n=1 Tax=Streptomyces sp. NPDC102406 TaxID=3366171 RepID=UPI00381C1313
MPSPLTLTLALTTALMTPAAYATPATPAAPVTPPTSKAAATSTAPPDGDPPEADLAFHGHARLTGTRLTVVLTPRNNGPHDIPDATLRLTLSSPLADAQTLPTTCLRSDRRALSCRTGPLPATTHGPRLTVPVGFAAAPTEITVEITTPWNGGPRDRAPDNNHLEVLLRDTDATYYF